MVEQTRSTEPPRPGAAPQRSHKDHIGGLDGLVRQLDDLSKICAVHYPHIAPTVADSQRRAHDALWAARDAEQADGKPAQQASSTLRSQPPPPPSQHIGYDHEDPQSQRPHWLTQRLLDGVRHFDGNDPSALPDFLEELDYIFDSDPRQFDPSRPGGSQLRIDILRSKTSGLARRWIRQFTQAGFISTEPTAWHGLREAFARQFSDPAAPQLGWQELGQLRQEGPYVRMPDYIARHMELCKRAEVQLDGQKARLSFEMGLHPDVREGMRGVHEKSLRELQDEALQIWRKLERDAAIDRRAW